MESHRDLYLVHFYFLIYVNDLPNVSKKLKFYLFADDKNIYCDGDTLTNLAKIVNKELKSVKNG